ncbi:uncharacterized protein LOC132178098 [Corylus avellana]|uniref:uncharacterized protein LOC132178098 n=1 Tax=Corylus avellana TaxID=13451 RepID=UPI00286C90A0|nr:uncharacterized protein LOC132178098 [Corylus avellana]
MTTKCPPHGFENERIIQYFYRGLNQTEHNLLESMNGGEFLNLTGEESYKTLDKLSEHTQQWDFQDNGGRQLAAPKTGGLYEAQNDTDIREELEDLRRQLDAMTLNKPVNVADTYQVDVCGLCASPMHFTQNCPSLSIDAEYPTKQVNAFNDYRKPTNRPFSETYNPGSGQPRPPAYQSITQVPHPASQLSLKDTLKAIMQTANHSIQSTDQAVQELKNATMANSRDIQELKNEFRDSKNFTHQAMSKMEGQIGQLANQISIKYKDPRCPTIACMIGDNRVNRVVLELGASVNILPYPVYVQLGMGELKPISITLPLVNRSIKVPRGTVEDVLIKVDKFYNPMDFIVLDTEPVINVELQI